MPDSSQAFTNHSVTTQLMMPDSSQALTNHYVTTRLMTPDSSQDFHKPLCHKTIKPQNLLNPAGSTMMPPSGLQIYLRVTLISHLLHPRRCNTMDMCLQGLVKLRWIVQWPILALCDLEQWPPDPQRWPFHTFARGPPVPIGIKISAVVFKISYSQVWQQTNEWTDNAR